MKAEEDVPRGDQVFDSYGMKDDSTFLMNYGFLPPSRKNIALVRADLDVNGPHYNDKKELLQIMNKDIGSYIWMETLENSDVRLSLGWYRFLVFEEKDTEFPCDLGKLMVGEISYCSLKNELKMWQRIKDDCAEVLKNYPTTVDEDKELLKDTSKFSFAEQNCIQLRYNEKLIMIYMVKTADIFLRLLLLSRKEANAEVNKMENFKEEFNYFKRIQKILKE